jgi:hypothetical protein
MDKQNHPDVIFEIQDIDFEEFELGYFSYQSDEKTGTELALDSEEIELSLSKYSYSEIQNKKLNANTISDFIEVPEIFNGPATSTRFIE